MNNNALMLLLPFLMNGKAGNMTGILTEILKSQPSGVDPMALVVLSMLTGKKDKQEEAADATDGVKNFGGEDVANMLRMLLKNKDQSV